MIKSVHKIFLIFLILILVQSTCSVTRQRALFFYRAGPDRSTHFLSQRDKKISGDKQDAAAFAFLFISLKDDAQVFKLCVNTWRFWLGATHLRNSSSSLGLNVSCRARCVLFCPCLNRPHQRQFSSLEPAWSLLFREEVRGKRGCLPGTVTSTDRLVETSHLKATCFLQPFYE